MRGTCITAYAAIALFLLSSTTAFAQHWALPANLVALPSPEGQRLLLESTAREDYWRLTGTYVTQKFPSFCGVASSVMVLNALRIQAPPDADLPGQAIFTQDNFFNEMARRVHPPESVSRGGMTLEQLADLLQSHPTQVRVVYANETSLEEFRALAVKNLSEPDNYVIVNYQRAELGQETSGHISPLAAYHAQADRFLLFDVARYKYPPTWVAAGALWKAMESSDISSGKSRGFVLVSAAATAPGPSGAKSARNPLHLFIGMIAGAFVLGAIAGASVQTIRLKRRAHRADAAR